MADFLDEKRREIAARLDELRPLVNEYTRLEAAAAALGNVADASPAGPVPRRTTRRQAPPAARRRTPGRQATPDAPHGGATEGVRPRGRPKGSGTRRNEALQLVKANPGITIPQIAEKMGIKQNYLYRVLPSLAGDGLVRKSGRGWHPSEPATA